MSYTLTLDRSEYSVIWLPPRLLVGANVEADLGKMIGREAGGVCTSSPAF